jgi:hypothetical protein
MTIADPIIARSRHNAPAVCSIPLLESIAAALQGDWAAALQTMQNGIASPEHAAFLEQLKQKTAEIKA